MAKMNIPDPPPIVSSKTEKGVAVYGATPAPIPAPPPSAEPIDTVDATPDELKPAVVRVEDAPKQAPTIPAGTPPQLQPEQAARELVEVRALAVRALDEVRTLGARVAAAADLAVRVSDVDNKIEHLRVEGVGNLRTELASAVAAFRAAEDAAVVKLSQLLAEPSRRLDAVDDVLLGLGQKTSRTTEPPVLCLRRTDPNRRYLAEPHVDGDAVVIPYSPRAGMAGMDPPDLRLSAGNTRNVFTGYAVDVPRGYACDVSVGEDILMTIRGRSEVELVVPARTRAANMHISQGGDLVRLSLRRLEVMSLKLG